MDNIDKTLANLATQVNSLDSNVLIKSTTSTYDYDKGSSAITKLQYFSKKYCYYWMSFLFLIVILLLLRSNYFYTQEEDDNKRKFLWFKFLTFTVISYICLISIFLCHNYLNPK